MGFVHKQSQWRSIVLCAVVVLTAWIGSTAAQGDSTNCEMILSDWVKAAAAPDFHMESATAVVDNKLYVISGFKDSSLKISNRVDVYNPATEIWETVANPRRPVPMPISHVQAAVDGRYIWIAGGFEGNHPAPPTDAVWQYDTVEDLWYQAPSLPAKRSGGLLVLQDRNLHYMGGTSADRDTSYSDHWRLNLDSLQTGWETVSALPEARNHVSGAFIDGIIYAVGGQFNHDHDPVDLTFVHAFDVASKQWSRKADLPFPRSHFETGTIVTDGRIIIVGGRANQNGYGFGQIVNVTEYNPAADTWRELQPLPVRLIAPVAVRIGDQLIVTNGGTNWNTGQRNTYISQISYDCREQTPPTLTNTLTSTSVPLSSTPQPATQTEFPTEVLLTPAATATLNDAPVETETQVVPTTPSEGVESTLTPTLPVATTEPSLTVTTLSPATTIAPTNTPVGQQVISLTLINAVTDRDIGRIQSGMVIDCAVLGTSRLNIRADTVPYPVGSVRFAFDSDLDYATENDAPYAIGGNNQDDYTAWTPPNGQHTLKATPWSRRNARGIEGTSLIVPFTVINCNG